MFNLFDEPANQEAQTQTQIPNITQNQSRNLRPQAPRARVNSVSNNQVLVLPKPNITAKKNRTLLDVLFGNNRNKKKSKGIFGF
jgi:hypothetical protein